MKVFFLILALIPLSFACFSSGVCGGGCGLPPIPPVCRSGCGQGYSCGQYGCYRMRARARSAKTVAVAGLGATSPDQRFMECCEQRNLPDSCLPKCNYRTYTRSALQAMYFRSDSCPMQAAADIHFCAAQGRDHTACCVRNGVTTTLAGPKCLTFCDQRPGNVTQLDFSYLACYDRFDSMKSCFWHDSNSRLDQDSAQEISPFLPVKRPAPRSQPTFTFSEDETIEVVAPPPTRPPKKAKTFN